MGYNLLKHCCGLHSFIKDTFEKVAQVGGNFEEEDLVLESLVEIGTEDEEEVLDLGIEMEGVVVVEGKQKEGYQEEGSIHLYHMAGHWESSCLSGLGGARRWVITGLVG